jgi:glycosyltransferase involved in cell wall biosynthesis
MSQRGVQVEHIVIDGGSNDGTRALLEEWCSDSCFRFISEPDTGVYDAFNKGLSLATGECIGFLNAGDIYQNHDSLAEIRAALTGKDIDLVFGDVEMTPAHDLAMTVRRYRAIGFSPSHLLRGFMPPHPATYVKKSTFDSVGVFCDKFRIAGDFEWAIRAFLLAEINSSYLAKTIVRMPVGGISNNGIRAIWRNTKEMHQALRMHDLPASWVRLLARLPRKWIRR